MAKQNVELKFSIKDGVSSGLAKIGKGVDTLNTKLGSVVGKATAATAALAAIGLGASLTQGVQDAAAFDAQLARIAATAGLTADELAQVKSAIEGAAAGSTATISETAAAFQTLAAEGLSASEAIAALPNTLALATAAQISTQEAAGALAATLDQFGLSADQAAKSADIIATAALSGGTGVNQLLQALEQAGPVARNAGLSLNETASALALLAQNGIEGGKAGGALRAILDGLSDPASRFSQELSKIGISSRDFSTVIDQLGVKGATAQNAINALGSRGTAALQALVRDGGGALDDLGAKLAGSGGSVQALADKIENTLPAAFENLKQAFSDVQQKFFEPLLGPIKTEVDGLEAQIRAFAESPEFKKLQGAFLDVFTAATKAVREFIAEFDFSGALTSFSQFTTQVSAEISTLLDKADKLATAFKVVKTAVEVVPNALDSASSAAAGAAAKLGALVSAPLGMISDDAERARQKLSELGSEGFADAAAAARDTGSSFESLIQDFFGVNTAAEENERVVSRAGRAHANLSKETLAASRAADGSAIAFQKGAQSVGDLGGKATQAAGDIQALKSELIALESGIAAAISAGSSQEAIDILVERANTLRANISALTPAAQIAGQALKKAGDDGAQAFDGTSQSASRAASEIQATGEAAQQSATMAAEGTASLSGVVAALFSKYSALSEAAGKFFAESLKNANFGSSSFESYGRAIEAADRATQQAYDNQIAGSQALIARLKEFAQAGTLAGASAADAFQYSESSLTSLLSAVEEGRSGFELLDRQSLSNLQSAIDAARQKTRQLADEAASAADQLNALGDQLEEQALRDAGNESEIARRAYEDRLKQIEDLAAKSGQAGAQSAARARALAQEEYERKLAQIDAEKQAEIRAARESADARIAENARVFNSDPSRTNASGASGGGALSTAPIDARSNSGLNATRDGDSISINMNFDKGSDIFQSRAVKEEVARIVAKEIERLTRRKR